MAIIYSYPEGTPTVTDTVLGTIYDTNGNVQGNPTRSFAIQDIINLVPPGAQGPAGATGPQGPSGDGGATGPEGAKGDMGEVAPAGLLWRGQWVSGDSYVINDTVGYNGASYFCILAISGILSPPSDPTHWALLAAQGATGPQGPIGATGAPGSLGPVGPVGPQGVPGTAGGLSSLNGLTNSTQLFAVGTTGTDFNIVSGGNTHTFNVPNASLTARGFINTTTQTFAGNKTFDDNVSVIGTFNLYDTVPAGYGSIGFNNNEFTVTDANSNQLFYADSLGTVQFNNAPYTQTLDFSGVTTRNYIFPDLDGTIALTSDIPAIGSFVPYVGATTNLNMGSFFVDALEYKFLDPAYSVYGRLFLDSEEFRFMTTPTATLATINYGQLLLQGISAYNATITYTTLTGNRAYALPNASGTIALTSNLSSYVPYTGATGAVNLGFFDLTVNQLTVGKGSGNASGNVAIGWNPLNSNTITGTFNVATGYLPLFSNTTGSSNVAIGALALFSNTTGTSNTSTGVNSLYNNSTGVSNTGFGDGALFGNTIGVNNTAIGRRALYTNTTGNNNISIGIDADNASPADSNSIVIGAATTGLGSNTVVIGNSSITKTILKGQIGIGTTAPVPSAQVQIDSTTKGFLPPRMTTTQINAIVTPAEGLVVYNTTISHLCFYNGTSWQKISHSNM